MLEIECPHCGIPLRIPAEMTGKSGTCNHCKGHFKAPSIWRYRAQKATPFARKFALAPFVFLWNLIRLIVGADEFQDMSQAEILMVKEARKQTRVQRASRSDTTCCLGCIIILLLLMAFGFLGPLLALLGLGGILASQ